MLTKVKGWNRISNFLLQGGPTRTLGLLRRFDPSKNSVHLVSLGCNEVPPEKYGGIELVVGSLAAGIADQGVDVVVYSPGKMHVAGARHCRTMQVPSRRVEGRAIANEELHMREVLRGLEQNVREGDAIVLNHPDHYRYLAKHLRWRLGAHVFEVAHWTHVALPDHIIYPSAGLKSFVGRDGTVIPHGINLRFRSHWSKREDFVFFAGRVTEDKGLKIVVEACESTGTPFVIAGPTPDQAFAELVFSSSAVTYVGELEYSDLLDYYARARCLAYMTQYVEPFGLTVVEAMAMGCPVLTTGLGGTGETVENGKTGYFCSNASELAAGIRKAATLSEDDIVDRARFYTTQRMSVDYLNHFAGF